MIARNNYIITASDLAKFNEIKAINPEKIWRHSDIKPLTDSPVLKSADRAGYYITIEPLNQQ